MQNKIKMSPYRVSHPEVITLLPFVLVDIHIKEHLWNTDNRRFTNWLLG